MWEHLPIKHLLCNMKNFLFLAIRISAFVYQKYEIWNIRKILKNWTGKHFNSSYCFSWNTALWQISKIHFRSHGPMFSSQYKGKWYFWILLEIWTTQKTNRFKVGCTYDMGKKSCQFHCRNLNNKIGLLSLFDMQSKQCHHIHKWYVILLLNVVKTK